MGNKWEVSVWRQVTDKDDVISTGKGDYHYFKVYAGKSFIMTLWNMWKYKHSGIGCIKLEWRP